MNQSTPVFLHGYSGDGQSLRDFAAACFPDMHPVCIDLPGFGVSILTNKAAETDPHAYLEETWHVIREAVPNGPIHLVGHSYGAVLAFALAAEHAADVSAVDLFAPGVYTKIPSQIGLICAKVFSVFPGGLTLFTWVLRRRLFVDIITKSMENKSWSEESRQRIYAMRRKESLTYSPQMFRLSLHARTMPRALESIHCSVPVRILRASDDTVATMQSAEWIKQRSESAVIMTTHGGHLGVVAEPERWARLMYASNS